MTSTSDSQLRNCIQSPAVLRLLNRFLNRLDRQDLESRSNHLSEILGKRHFPELFAPQLVDDDRITWHWLKETEKLGSIELVQTRKRGIADRLPWDNCRVVFRPEAEDLIRAVLCRPRVDPNETAWLNALSSCQDRFAQPELLSKPCFPALKRKREPEAILERLALIPDILQETPMSLYQLSARLFWGQSKLLKGREEWLQELFGQPLPNLLPRPVLLEMFFPETPKGVLLIENLDTFLAACDGRLPAATHQILVYAQGFKNTAARIRDPLGVRFFWRGASEKIHQEFEDFWFGRITKNWPLCFFGDLDWAGMQMLALLRRIFPNISAWKPGYSSLLSLLKAGEGHSPEEADKEGQVAVTKTGDPWADEFLLPTLGFQGRFVDQEAFRK
ncbi:hypothetical protein DSLASN_30630 [Desulfoluna limicola]|uniref:Wadjet protein JetD C-terminal domain-containing protein n=1 Tax=Desulfoluna limicola TaxID=2810562 RepID=A0ABM7PJ63_9BACT|nr:DUF2220 family protein [Desulfoluna limicola]BCS97431.1 hypothetical protein DSLASN_30630 [Desulfoluna limicola]